MNAETLIPKGSAMNMKTSLENAKCKIKDNLPVVLTSVAAIGSAAVVVYTSRKLNIKLDSMFPEPKKVDFSLHLSGREMDKILSGTPKNCLDNLYIVTKDMLTSEAQEAIPRVIFKDYDLS
jgi:hypothetical protein